MACTLGARVAKTEIPNVEVAAGHATEHVLPDLQPAGARIRPVRTQHNIEGMSVPQPEQRTAAELIREHRKTLVDKVTYWTGVQRPTAKKLVESVEQRVRALELRVNTRREPEYITELSVYLTAFAMNYLLRGNFVQR